MEIELHPAVSLLPVIFNVIVVPVEVMVEALNNHNIFIKSPDQGILRSLSLLGLVYSLFQDYIEGCSIAKAMWGCKRLLMGSAECSTMARSIMAADSP